MTRLPLFKHISGNLAVFAVTDLMGNFGRGMVFPYASLFILALGGDATQIGIIAFISQLAGLFLLPVAGYITDHADRIRVIVLAGVLFSLFMVMMVFAPSWQMIAVASLLTGTVVFQFPAYAALIADSLSPTSRGQGIGLLNTISSSLAIFAPYIAGIIIDRYTANLGMRLLYAAMLILSLVASLIQLRFLKESSTTQREPLHIQAMVHALNQAYRDIPQLIKGMSGSLKILTLIIVLTLITNGLTGNFWVIYATNQIGLSAAEWGLILLVESVVRTLFFFPAGLLVDRFGRTTVLIVALVIFTIASPAFIMFKGIAAIIMIRSAFSIAFVFGIPACTALMADLVPRTTRGQVMAAIGQGGILLGMIGGAGGPAVGYLIIPPLMVASLAGGLLYTLNPTYPWIISAGIGLLCILLSIFFIRDPKHQEI